MNIRHCLSGLIFVAIFIWNPLAGQADSKADSKEAVLSARLDQLASAKSGTFFVSLKGNDQWSGHLADPAADGTDGPFLTLDRAKRAARSLKDRNKPIVIVVRGGIYELDHALEFASQDGGTDQAPVIWRAAEGEEVRLLAGKYLNNPEKVSDPAAVDLLKPEIRDKVVQIDLKKIGISEFGSPAGGGAEIFLKDTSYHLSRYPNEGFMKITGLQKEGTNEQDIRGTKGIKEGFFQTDDQRIFHWKKEKDPWVHGYWFWDWADQRQKIVSIDPNSGMIKVAPPYHTYGYRLKQWFYAYNLLSELDEPGEFYIDRDKGLLFLYPTGKIEKNSLMITNLKNAVKMVSASNVIFYGFTLEGCRNTAIDVQNGEGNLIAGCTVKNVGGFAISMYGKNQSVYGCHLCQMGKGGITISGGDRNSLTPGNCIVKNNDIHDFGRIQRMYAGGITCRGVGNRVCNNKIYNAPHTAIFFGGNDQEILLNEIFNVCFESNDAGAIYSGRNWTMRGNLVKNNYLHDISGFRNKGCVGVYLDDMFSSADIVGNLFVRTTRAAMIGGGRDCSIVNNIFIDCKPSVHVDARALGWAHGCADGWINEANTKGTISGIKWKEAPYGTKYPKLAKILDGEPKAPEGNLIARNIIAGIPWDSSKGLWQGDAVEKKAKKYVEFKDNIIGIDPCFVDAKNGNYNLRPESPALKAGFEKIPFEKIGLYDCPFAKKRND
ncbi:MAG: right-handed parallel beta-helix repeat-containing protein [Planctomycetia bacterium]|nr:right-handed parallel beta-helix repeat-containing protein [Planctomycetia bacterium]